MLSRVSRLARRLDRARDVAFAAPRAGRVGVRRAGRAAPHRAPVPAHPRAAAGRDPGHQRDDDQPDRPPGDARAGRAANRCPTTAGARGSPSPTRAAAGSTRAFIDLLAEERDLLAVLPPDGPADLAASLRHLLLQFESPTG